MGCLALLGWGSGWTQWHVGVEKRKDNEKGEQQKHGLHRMWEAVVTPAAPLGVCLLLLQSPIPNKCSWGHRQPSSERGKALVWASARLVPGQGLPWRVRLHKHLFTTKLLRKGTRHLAVYTRPDRQRKCSTNAENGHAK